MERPKCVAAPPFSGVVWTSKRPIQAAAAKKQYNMKRYNTFFLLLFLLPPPLSSPPSFSLSLFLFSLSLLSHINEPVSSAFWRKHAIQRSKCLVRNTGITRSSIKRQCLALRQTTQTRLQRKYVIQTSAGWRTLLHFKRYRCSYQCQQLWKRRRERGCTKRSDGWYWRTDCDYQQPHDFGSPKLHWRKAILVVSIIHRIRDKPDMSFFGGS